MTPPICPMQNVPPVDNVVLKWAKDLIFGRAWYLFFAGLGTAVRGLLSFPRYADMVMTFPGTLITGSLIPSYPCPPQQICRGITYDVLINIPPTGSNITFEIIRYGPSSPLGAVIANAVIFAGVNNAIVTPVTAQDFTEPGAVIQVRVTAVGSGTPGADLRVLARVEGVF